MHERLHEMNLLVHCEWRGVQHASHLPRPMKPWQGSLGAELRHEVTVVQRLAPGLPIVLPPGKPNTRPAIEQAVALLRRDRPHMSDFNCPFCYAMHERLHEMNLLVHCEWRGVQHASHLPRPMKPWQGSLGAELRHEVTVVQGWRQGCRLCSLLVSPIRDRLSNKQWHSCGVIDRT